MEKMEELHAMECMDNTENTYNTDNAENTYNTDNVDNTYNTINEDNAYKAAVVNTSVKKKCADSNEHLYKSCTQRLIMWMHLMMITFMIV